MAGLPDETSIAVSSPWRPLSVPLFRNLLIADVLSDVGTFMQSVGAAWLMVSLHAGPAYIALTQTASAFAFFLFALPAGALGDIVDRRRLILSTEVWMFGVALVIAAATFAGLMTPWLVLGLTFALSAGDAIEAPSWRAVLPELVGKEDLAAASALNGIEFNFARAVGPALAGFIIAAVGVGAAFALNAASFLGVIVVVARWKRPEKQRTSPPETVTGAMVAALRYVRHEPGIRHTLARVGVTMFFASALLALLPSVAHAVSSSPSVYGILLGCFGAGAVLGAGLIPRLRARWSIERVATGGVVFLGLDTIVIGLVRAIPALAAVMLVAGAAWIVFISLVNALTQQRAPDWVRARVLAVFLLVFQGAMAAGSALWGGIASRAGVESSLIIAGLGIVASAGLAFVVRLPDATSDPSPWNHWRMPAIVDTADVDPDAGPVLVTSEYVVAPDVADDFLDAIHAYGRVRRRDGAYAWAIFRDLEAADRYVEAFIVSSWAEHLRQHERSTVGDREIEERVRQYAARPPVVRHMVSL